MANLSLPKRGKGPAPQLDDASSNLGKVQEDKEREPIKYMSFKIEESFQRQFKQRALDDGITMTELLKRSFDHYNK